MSCKLIAPKPQIKKMQSFVLFYNHIKHKCIVARHDTLTFSRSRIEDNTCRVADQDFAVHRTSFHVGCTSVIGNVQKQIATDLNLFGFRAERISRFVLYLR